LILRPAAAAVPLSCWGTPAADAFMLSLSLRFSPDSRRRIASLIVDIFWILIITDWYFHWASLRDIISSDWHWLLIDLAAIFSSGW
jgi:hypothetical protein